MRDFAVVWSRESVYDVADIADYIELYFGRERADRFNDEIDVQGDLKLNTLFVMDDRRI